jgi:predicted dehydrogenase
MSNRREFIHGVLGTTASVAVSGLVSSRRVLGASDRIRIGLIGAGARGKYDFEQAIKCPNVEPVAVADVYTRHLDEVKAMVPGIKTYQDFRHILDDKSIDAVIVVTPQHQHALSFVPAIQAGKDVYQEKTMAFNPEHARRMRRAYEGSGRVVQIGMQMQSGPGYQKVRELATPERIGTVTMVETHHFRNAPYGGWMRKEVPSDCDAQHINWELFEGEARHYAFDPDRYLNWRFYFDYSGGNMFENMVHQIGFWYQLLNLQVPETVSMLGANYLSPKMHMPDAMAVTFKLPNKCLMTWSSTFSNDFYGEQQGCVFGTKGSIMHTQSNKVYYLPQGQLSGEGSGDKPIENPEYVDNTDIHMQNWFDCIRSRKEPNCPFEVGYRTALACQMAVASYRRGVPVHWDADTEDIV